MRDISRHEILIRLQMIRVPSPVRLNITRVGTVLHTMLNNDGEGIRIQERGACEARKECPRRKNNNGGVEC